MRIDMCTEMCVGFQRAALFCELSDVQHQLALDLLALVLQLVCVRLLICTSGPRAICTSGARDPVVKRAYSLAGH